MARSCEGQHGDDGDQRQRRQERQLLLETARTTPESTGIVHISSVYGRLWRTGQAQRPRHAPPPRPGPARPGPRERHAAGGEPGMRVEDDAGEIRRRRDPRTGRPVDSPRISRRSSEADRCRRRPGRDRGGPPEQPRTLPRSTLRSDASQTHGTRHLRPVKRRAVQLTDGNGQHGREGRVHGARLMGYRIREHPRAEVVAR